MWVESKVSERTEVRQKAPLLSEPNAQELAQSVEEAGAQALRRERVELLNVVCAGLEETGVE